MNNMLQELKVLLKDERAQGDSASTLYMIIIIAIVAIALIALVKPMFNKSMKYQAKVADLPNQSVAQSTNSASSAPQ